MKKTSLYFLHVAVSIFVDVALLSESCLVAGAVWPSLEFIVENVRSAANKTLAICRIINALLILNVQGENWSAEMTGHQVLHLLIAIITHFCNPEPSN